MNGTPSTVALVVLAVIAVFALGRWFTEHLPRKPAQVEVRDLLVVVKRALAMAAATLGSTHQSPPLKKVTLSLQTVSSDVQSENADLVVLQLGRGRTTTLTSTITLTLEPPEGITGAKREEDLARTLANAIVAAWRAKETAVIVGLDKRSVSAEISFGVQTEAKGACKLVVGSLTGGFSRAYSHQTIQTMTVEFGDWPNPQPS